MRQCTICKCLMSEGYYVEPFEYYCSDSCLHDVYTQEDYEAMYAADVAFWTEWEDDGEEIEEQLKDENKGDIKMKSNNVCELCNNHLHNAINLGEHQVCFSCFFDDTIPSAIPQAVPAKLKQRMTDDRNKAIQQRIETILKQLDRKEIEE